MCVINTKSILHLHGIGTDSSSVSHSGTVSTLLTPCHGSGVVLPAPVPSFHGGNAAIESRRFWETCGRGHGVRRASPWRHSMAAAAVLPAPVPSFHGGHAAVESFPQPTQINSSLDKKMPRSHSGHGMTEEGVGHRDPACERRLVIYKIYVIL